MLHPIFEEKLPEVKRLLKEHHVKRAYAFGSVVNGKFTDKSDIDLLIAFDITEPFDGYAQNFWDMQDKLKALLNRNVDLVPEHTLSNKYFIDEMNKTKTLLYE
ncbi:MAG: nucleotidyltransferase domain-containing protein [Bacteroidetes bacterium]|nr:nucleotidyltransferase domain-containing protein [Bacteroidota bacterium]